jgi:ARG and Rhodanese-Phosphatase-superfamily-associated Protein domain
MKELDEDLSSVTVGQAQQFRGIAIFPLSRNSDTSIQHLDYTLLDEAIATGTVRVTETSKGGSVPEIHFENRGETAVLLVDGQELIGAKQNRTVNLTILAPGKRTTIIPVSCVEAGRWSPKSTQFESSKNFMYPSGRASHAAHVTQSMRSNGTRRSDQRAVWNHIAGKAARFAVRSPTSAMSAIYERQALDLEEFVRAFQVAPGQLGIAFATRDGSVGFDLFDRATTLSKLFSKLIRSYVLDALDKSDGSSFPTHSEVEAYVKSAGTAQCFTEPSVGLGKDILFSSSEISGAALWAEERYMHIWGYHPNAENAQAFNSRIASPRMRRL